MKNIIEIPKEAKYAILSWTDQNNDSWSITVHGEGQMFKSASILYSQFLARLQQVENWVCDSNDEMRGEMIEVMQELRRRFEIESLEDVYEHMLYITNVIDNE
jgi:hypothetical protein